MFIVFVVLSPLETLSAAEAKEITFAIHSFYIEGNTVLETETLTTVVNRFIGENKKADDVELARDALEKLYHESGYPTVLVNIPEQTVDDGIVRLVVIESRIKRVYVVGNKYFTMENIKESLPSIQTGKILFLPQVKKELADINRNPDLKIAPILIPGKELGTIDVELKAEDKLPLHGSIELNNRSSHDTTSTRLNGIVRYDNLWQKKHSVSAQFQTAPEDTDEVMVISASYSAPAPWKKEHLVIGYFIDSDSETASGEGFNVIGRGRIFGMRYMLPLPSAVNYDHNLTCGFDWKDFEDNSSGEPTPVEYIPFTAGYSSYLSDRHGTTQFSADLNFLIRDFFVNEQNEFATKQEGSSGNYIYLTAGLERRQRLPGSFSLFAKLDGQAADQPLISNEKYSAGGVNSLRGYKESEKSADNSLHGTLELFAPDLLKKHTDTLIPYLFYDFAWLGKREASFGDDQRFFIHGCGIGITGRLKEKISYKFDWGVALKDTDDTGSGDHRLHFKISYSF